MKINDRVVIRSTGSTFSAGTVTVKKVDEKKLRHAMTVAMTTRKRALAKEAEKEFAY